MNNRTCTIYEKKKEEEKEVKLPWSLYHFDVNLSSFEPTQQWKEGRRAGVASEKNNFEYIKHKFNLWYHILLYSYILSTNIGPDGVIYCDHHLICDYFDTWWKNKYLQGVGNLCLMQVFHRAQPAKFWTDWLSSHSWRSLILF